MSDLASIAKDWIGGLAVYQPGRPIEEVARELGLGDPAEFIKLASNENALGPSPLAIEAMKRCASRMHIYPDGGTFELRRALAARLGVRDDQLFISHGSNEIIQLLGHVFLDETRNIVVSDHAFIVYRLVAALYRAGVISVPMKSGLVHDLTAMAKAIDEQTRVVFISNPNNPTGTMVEGAEIDAFMRDVPAHTAVVFDEAYIELVDERDRPDTLRYVREGRNVFVLRTFSKAYGLAGLRVGYAAAPAEGVNLLHHVRQPFNVSAMAQEAATASLADEAFVERTRAQTVRGLERVGAAMRELGFEVVPSRANFLLVRVGRGRDVFEALQREKVIVRPVDVYDLPEYVRITVGTDAENEKLIAAMKRVTGAGGADA